MLIMLIIKLFLAPKRGCWMACPSRLTDADLDELKRELKREFKRELKKELKRELKGDLKTREIL